MLRRERSARTKVKVIFRAGSLATQQDTEYKPGARSFWREFMRTVGLDLRRPKGGQKRNVLANCHVQNVSDAREIRAHNAQRERGRFTYIVPLCTSMSMPFKTVVRRLPTP